MSSTSTVEANGLRFDVHSAGPGDGALVLLLHGFPQNGSAWGAQLATLSAAGYRAVAPDQRGYSPGARPSGVDAYKVSELAADVLAIAAALGHERFHVVGHDWGGVVAWYLAANSPERLASNSAVSTPHPRAFVAAMTTSTQPLRSSYVALFRVPWVPERLLGLAGHRALRSMLVASGLPRPRAGATAAWFERSDALPTALAWYRANGTDLAAATGPARVPTLYVWGSRDAALGRVAAERTVRYVDAAYQFEVLRGASHWIPETEADRLDPLLLDHLRRNP